VEESTPNAAEQPAQTPQDAAVEADLQATSAEQPSTEAEQRPSESETASTESSSNPAAEPE
jgi:hypothetical protein